MNKVYHNEEEERQKLISIFSSPQTLDLVSGGVGTFQCKTCGKWFPSFQALGGHRTSHNRFPCRTKRALQLDLDIGKPVPAKRKKMKTTVHVCSVCGLEFSVGQALGGHMRRHNRKEKNSNNVGSLVTEDNAVMDSITSSSCSNHDNNNDGESRDGSNSSNSSNGLCLELRLSPPDFDVGLLNLRLGLGF